jgi:hypothetical protein
MSNNPTSEKLTFIELVSKHNIEIPIIQRDYAQGRDGKQELRKNFLNSLLAAVDGKPLELDFVYGNIIDCVLQPLDGQQRLTTLFLLHWFVAVKENELNDEIKKLLKKFTYETRTSSSEFCEELINKGISYNTETKISELIIDNSWFFLSWKRDPTINSMLTMLDAIQQTFHDKTNVLEKLENITFHFIELQNFGLSDDLYIKMNARGKALTEFENFKAKFEQYVRKESWENNVEVTNTFSYQIDTIWTDLFWNYRNDKHLFDEQILNFFKTFALINYTLKSDTKSIDYRSNVDFLRDKEKTISFNQYLDLGCIDEEYFKMLKSVLNNISNKSGLKTFLSDKTYVDEINIFNGAIKNNLSYPDLVIAFAYYQYLALNEIVEIEKLKSWMRIVRNLVEGSRPYLFNNANEFANALRSIEGLLNHSSSIIDYFSNESIDTLSGFIKEQVSEEKQKAKLIDNNDWKNVILEFENHVYFNGQIGFVLDWCKDENGIHNINKFKEYAEKAKAIFGDSGLNNFEGFLFERALLASGDYLLKRNSNYSFLINSERDISWKRFLRDNNERRGFLKQLIDKISVANLQTDLQRFIDDFSDKNNWRYYFIKQHEMIKACGEQKLIRWSSESDILLLGSTTTSGYHKEYYSYSLFENLKRKLSLEDRLYKDQKSVDVPKYFELADKQISFDCKRKKYVWTQNNELAKTQEFESRDEAISVLLGTNN